jgi:signal transduction histidine kinase
VTPFTVRASTVGLSRIYFAAGLALIGVYFALPSGGRPQSILYDVIGGSAAITIAIAIRLHRPRLWVPWALFAAGNGFFVLGDILSSDAQPPTVSDGFYLAGYPVIAAGLLILVLSAGGSNRIAALGDAAIFTVAFALFQWIFVIGPAVRESGSLATHVVAGLYPGMDIILLGGLLGFFVSPAWRTPAFRLIIAAVLALLIGDMIYGLDVNAYASGGLVDVTWLLSYVLWATAALHPTMRELSEPHRERSLRVGPVRVAVLAAALLTVPLVLFVQALRDQPREPYVVAALGGAIALLVAARLSGILSALERFKLLERSARSQAEETQYHLARQNEELIEADRLKDEFVALISHDLRTPLTSIIGYVELALDEEVETPLDEERRSYLDVVVRSSQRLLRLVDDLLFAARLQSGKLVLATVEVDLCRIAEQAVDEARPRAEAKMLTISFLGDVPVVIEADKGRIFQLLDNLISNAIKFTPDGGRVEVRVEPAIEGAVIEVSDTGIGLSPAEAELVFDRFFRSSHSLAQQVPGTGLGLFISRAIAEAHGGVITLSSQEGAGTTFRIELPSTAAAPKAESPDAALVA